MVVRAIRDRLGLEVSGRPAKSTNSIIGKLKRESIRLTQIQDIAGCRLVVSDLTEQERVVRVLVETFPGAAVIDRRKSPSHGYRAVHVVVENSGQLVELQIRTRLQHMWAELSEKYADIFGLEIKYGGGNEDIRKRLEKMAHVIARYEDLEFDHQPELGGSLPKLKEDLLEILSDEITELQKRSQKRGEE